MIDNPGRGFQDRADPEKTRLADRAAQHYGIDLRQVAQLRSIAQASDARIEVSEPSSARDIILRATVDQYDDTRAWATRLGRVAMILLGTAALLTLAFALHREWRPAGGESFLVVDELVTGTRESNTVRLSDGSIVRLGPESRLQLTPGGPGRRVILEGRAFFAVAANDRDPFRVVTPAGSVRALGTRFHLDAEVSEIRLIVLEGRVALDGTGEEIELASGQMLHRLGRTPGRVEPAPSLAELSSGWMGQFLVFQKTPLSRAVRDIEQIYDVDVVITKPTSPEPTLTMWLSQRALEEVVTVICSVIDARCWIDGRTVIIAPAEEGSTNTASD